VRFDRERLESFVALRNTIAIVAPLAAGVAMNAPQTALVASMGALNVSFSDGSDPYALRAGRMLATAVLGAGAVCVGALCARNDMLAIAAVTLCAAGAGILVALDQAAANIGLISLVMMVVSSGHGLTAPEALYAGTLALAGGLLQTTLSIALWPVRRYEPERRALATFYTSLSQMASSSIEATHAPPASAAGTDAQRLLSGLRRVRTIQGERYISLLAQAERIRLSIIVLARSATRLLRYAEASDAPRTIEGCFRAAGSLLGDVAAALSSVGRAYVDPRHLHDVHDASRRLREFADGHLPAELRTLADDARQQVDALAGQLRTAADLAVSSTITGREAFERGESQLPRRLRLGGALATLRANLNLRSAAFRHSLRLAASLAVAQVLAREVGGERAYWIAMTAAIVLKPDFTATFARGLARVACTFAGLALATLLFHFLQPSATTEIVMLAVFAFLMRWAGSANYGVFVIAASALAVLLFALTGVQPAEVIAERGWFTLLGGLLALAAYAVWPTWERSRIHDNLANMVDAYRAYFRSVREAYVHPNAHSDHTADHARLAARLARSNVEASLERFAAEPGTAAAALGAVNAMLASSHRLVHAVMALEAGLARSRPAPPRPEFISFADSVERTMHSLAGALRGSPLRIGELPDLRERHSALLAAGDPLVERYALVNVETDRITNSLNTLAGQVVAWRSGAALQ
jgi:uncharacterized membrane protein YccC